MKDEMRKIIKKCKLWWGRTVEEEKEVRGNRKIIIFFSFFFSNFNNRFRCYNVVFSISSLTHSLPLNYTRDSFQIEMWEWGFINEDINIKLGMQIENDQFNKGERDMFVCMCVMVGMLSDIITYYWQCIKLNYKYMSSLTPSKRSFNKTFASVS